jgi:hypothetical protein
MHWNFIVKAEIEIFQGKYDYLTHTVAIGSGEKIASITTMYPVDIFFNDDPAALGGVPFNPKYVHTNWPRQVKYNPSGYEPNFQKDALYFKYGPESNSPVDPKPIYLAQNLTPDI